MSLWLIPAAASIFGGIADYNAGKKMDALADQQALMVEKNAALEKRELDEKLRRQARQNAMTSGKALAAAAGSGATMTGSPTNYIEFIEQEQKSQLDWTKESGQSQIDLKREAGMIDVQSARIAADAKKMGLFTGIMNAANFMGQGGLFTNPTGGATSTTFTSTTKPNIGFTPLAPGFLT